MSIEHHVSINETVYHFARGYLNRMGWFASLDGTSESPTLAETIASGFDARAGARTPSRVKFGSFLRGDMVRPSEVIRLSEAKAGS